MYRLLEKKLKEKFTCNTIIQNLRNMNFKELKGNGYIPTYARTDFTDALHEAFGFRTDYEIVTLKQMKKFLEKQNLLTFRIIFPRYKSPNPIICNGAQAFYFL